MNFCKEDIANLRVLNNNNLHIVKIFSFLQENIFCMKSDKYIYYNKDIVLSNSITIPIFFLGE